MSEAQPTHESHRADASRPPQKPLHRVCIQCNNMFVVSADRFDAKQCPNCHKG